MLLDTSSRTVTLVMGEVKTTVEVDVIAHFEDDGKERISPVTQLTHSIGTTLVIIIPAPQDNFARRVKEITVYNADSVTHNVEILLAGFGVVKFALATLKTYMYTSDKGWFAV